MWKLFATIVALTDTGSISVSSFATDFVDQPACQTVARDFKDKGDIDRDLAGRRIIIRVSAECRPAASGPNVAGVRPPPFPFPFFVTR